jgi:mono/diheme cytochrome c family protein
MSNRRVATLTTAVCAAVSVFGFTVAATAQDNLVDAGKVIFEETAGDVGCAYCHAADASGDVGPNIQGMDVDTIRNAVHGGIAEMEFFDLTDDEIDQVAAYLATF